MHEDEKLNVSFDGLNSDKDQNFSNFCWLKKDFEICQNFSNFLSQIKAFEKFDEHWTLRVINIHTYSIIINQNMSGHEWGGKMGKHKKTKLFTSFFM